MFDPEQVFASPALRVLVANNNMEAADNLTRLLRAEGYRVSVCYDSQATLPMALACRPDAVLLSLGRAGPEVVRRLRESLFPQPLLVALADDAGLPELRDLLAARPVLARVRAA